MAINNSVKEAYLNSLTENYMDKLFYFYLKKTGTSCEAENLTSDILLNIITSIERGNTPEVFDAWVWGIARNRYSVWAKGKHIQNRLFVNADIGDYEIPDNTANTENKVVHSENLNLLRRELAFVSSEYRDIVVAYYIEDRKVKDIALTLNLPEGTVKSKLFRARKILKEGMNMAREFGTRSYNPENISFMSSGNQPSGLPWSAVQRKLPKNILIEADNNPLTVEELSIELGIAAPYMEEEIKLLTDATLLKKIDNKYLTNIFIASKDCQVEIYNAQIKSSSIQSELINEIIIDSSEQIRNLGIVKNAMSDEEIKWWMMLYAMDWLLCNLKGYDVYYPEKRANGEMWGFMGLEICDLPACFVGRNGHGDGKNLFHTYKIPDYNLLNRVGEMDNAQTIFLADIIKNNRKLSSFTYCENDIWEKINHRFAHSDKDGNIIPDIIVLDTVTKQKCIDILLEHPLTQKLVDTITAVFEQTVKVLKRYSNPSMDNQILYCASMLIIQIKMMMIRNMVEKGQLVVPENPDSSTIAMWIELE